MLPAESAGDRYAQLCYAAEEPEAMLAALESSFLKNRPDAGDALSREIRQNLDALNQEKIRRQREKEAERKWQLAQEQKRREKQEKRLFPAGDKPVEVAVEPAASLFEESWEASEEHLPEDLEEQEEESLKPLKKEDATTELFEKKPGLNDVLSVMKLTWKLARKK